MGGVFYLRQPHFGWFALEYLASLVVLSLGSTGSPTWLLWRNRVKKRLFSCGKNKKTVDMEVSKTVN
jgi:hypothetical protein